MATLYQLELDSRKIDCGMSYVFRLSDGRFFLMDGGYFTPGEEDRLFDFLKRRAEGNIHICGWFFSHAHQDHVGNFINFIRKYGHQVRIDALLYNFQPCDFSALGDDDDWKGSDPATFREFYRAIDESLPDAERIIIKTGDVYDFAELRLEILYTQNDLTVPSTFNDCSAVAMAKVDGTRILFLGDVFVEGARVLLRNPEKLAADIVQISHHGFSGPSEDLYAATCATVALWPTPPYVYDRFMRGTKYPGTRYMIANPAVKEHIVSGFGTAELHFPYVPLTAKTEAPRFREAEREDE